MKRLISRHAAIIPLMAAFFFATSCIYDAPDDRFYRTLWTTEESPLEGLTIEFLCGNGISAQSESAASGSYGSYETHELTAYFTGLSITYDAFTAIIEEAHRTDDLLLISWHVAEPLSASQMKMAGRPDVSTGVSYTTRLHRLSSY